MDVTGPIQPNDIVMRASEIGQSMPGIGALAYKQARKGAQKGIKGIHMIPDTTNQNMDFMGIAKQNVNSQLTNMANTVEAASAPPGHMLAFITPEEAGVLKLLGGTGEMTSSGIPAFPPSTQSGPGANVGPSNKDKEDRGGNRPNMADIAGPSTPSTDTTSSVSNLDDKGGGGLSETEIKERLRNPNRFAPEDVQSAIDQANAAGMNTADAFGNKLGGGNNETSKSLAVRDMMMNAAGYNPNIKGYDNPFNQGMGLDVGYSSYDKLIGKGYTPQEIARMEFTQSKGLLGDMKFNATLDGKSVGAFNINKPGGFLDNVFGRGGFTFTRDYMGQGNRGRDRDRRNFVEEVIDEEVGSGAGETSDYLDASQYYLPSDYTSDRITEGDLVPGRRRFMLRKDGKKVPEGDSLTLDEIRDYAMVGGFNLLEPFSEYQARRRQYYGAPDFGQGTDFDYSGSTGGTGN